MRPRAALVALLLVLVAILSCGCASRGAPTSDGALVRLTFLQVNDDYVLGPVDGGYLVRGGDGYTAFARGTVLVDESSGPQVAQIVMDAIVARGAIAPATDERIVTGSR